MIRDESTTNLLLSFINLKRETSINLTNELKKVLSSTHIFLS